MIRGPPNTQKEQRWISCEAVAAQHCAVFSASDGCGEHSRLTSGAAYLLDLHLLHLLREAFQLLGVRLHPHLRLHAMALCQLPLCLLALCPISGLPSHHINQGVH